MSELKNKPSVLVTGAYGGMGKATVEALVNNGFFVFALDKNVGKAKENVLPVQADLTDEESVKNAFSIVREHTAELYAIIHFAGVYMLNSLVEIELADFEKILKINLVGAYLVNKEFLQLLKNGSRILITTSELAPLDPLPFTGIYAVTKSALDKYAFSLAMELQLKGVGESVLRAGAVETEMLGASTSALDSFCENTALYTCNSKRFKNIVNKVESRCISPNAIANKVLRIIQKHKPRFAYSINRNPLLLLLNALPKGAQLFAIKQILKNKTKD